MRLFEKLISIKEERLTSFHVPGHKGSSLYNKYFDRMNNILDIDLTEFPGTDDLHDPETCIKESQEYASEIYKSDHTFFLVNGTTSGIYASVMAVTSPGDHVIVARDCHRAVFDSLQLGALKASYVKPEIDYKANLVLGITVESLKCCIDENPDAKAVILTYPNYNGICSDMESIVKLVHESNMVLIVDEAHGAHLLLDDTLPKSSLEFGADIVVHSAHKSLPVMTQASMLHVKSELVSLSKLKYMIKLHQSSSPSYILMSSLDIAMDIIKIEGQRLMTNLLENIEDFKLKCSKKGYNFLDRDDVKKRGFDLDISKLTLLGKTSNIDPNDLEVSLRMSGIQLEFSNQNNATFVASICNEKADFDKLYKTMEKAKIKCYSGIDTIQLAYSMQNKLSIKDAFYARSEEMVLTETVGRISSEYLIPYPPGVPVLIPGEVVSSAILDLIKSLIENNQKIVGSYGSRTTYDKIKIRVVKS